MIRFTSVMSGVADMIGNTPMLKTKHLATGVCELFLKLECQNPGGSVKDRVAVSMIEEAEKSGALQPGAGIIEATAGNTGLGLALVASQKGYPLTLVVPDKMSEEKIAHLQTLGAKVIVTRSDVGKGHPEYYQDMAARLAEENHLFYVNQFENAANPLTHEVTTGPEIREQMNKRLDAVVCGVGSGGTLTGLGRYFRRTAPTVEMVLADPEGSVLVPYWKTGQMIQAGSWVIEGIGEDFIPKNCDLSLVRHGYTISDQESIAVAREVSAKEGILVGSSSGTIIAAALRFCLEQKMPKRVVALVPDTGNKYLSKIYNDEWLKEHHFHG